MATFPDGAVRATGYFGLSDPTDTYATHVDILGWGGKMTVDTVTERNAIPTARRKFGMIVTVIADPTPANNKSYQLQNTALGGSNNTITDNANWVEFLSGFTLSNGSGTTANGSAVDLGGTVSADVILDGATNTYDFTLLDFAEVRVTNATLFSVDAAAVNFVGLTENVTVNALYYDTGTGAITFGDAIISSTPRAEYFQGNGATTEFTLAYSGDVSIHFVDLGGVVQENDVNVTIDNGLKKVTFTTAPSASQRVGVYYYTGLSIGGGGGFALSNGSGTTANIDKVDLGGTADGNIIIDMNIAQFEIANASIIRLYASDSGGFLDLQAAGSINIETTTGGGDITLSNGASAHLIVDINDFDLSGDGNSVITSGGNLIVSSGQEVIITTGGGLGMGVIAGSEEVYIDSTHIRMSVAPAGGSFKIQDLESAVTANVLYYDPTSDLVTYGTAPGGGFASQALEEDVTISDAFASSSNVAFGSVGGPLLGFTARADEVNLIGSTGVYLSGGTGGDVVSIEISNDFLGISNIPAGTTTSVLYYDSGGGNITYGAINAPWTSQTLTGNVFIESNDTHTIQFGNFAAGERLGEFEVFTELGNIASRGILTIGNFGLSGVGGGILQFNRNEGAGTSSVRLDLSGGTIPFEIDNLSAGTADHVLYYNTTTNEVTHGAAPGGGSGSYTFGNGLTEASGDVVLGGAFTQNTTVIGDENVSCFHRTVDNISFADIISIAVGLLDGPQRAKVFAGEDTGGGYNSAILTESADGSGSGFVESYSSNGYSRTSIYNYAGFAYVEIDVDPSASKVEVDGDASFTGITYTSDFSANFTTRSLVDKDYVDTAVTSAVLSDGDMGDITVSGSGTIWTIDNNVVTLAKLAQSTAALSVIGRTTNTAGNYSELTTSTAGHVLRASSTSALGFGTLLSTSFADNTIAPGRLTNGTALSILGRSANSAGVNAFIAASAGSGAVLRESGSTIGWGTIATAGIADDAVTYTKIQNVVADNVFLGNISGAGSPVAEITVAQATALLNTFSTSTTDQGLVVGSNSVGAGYFLQADNTWAIPVSVVNNGSNNAIVKSDGTDLQNTGWSSAATGILTGVNSATPPTIAADTASMYVNDVAAGNAAFHFKTEAGNIVKLYEVATYTISNWSTLRTLDATSGTITIQDVIDVLLTFIDDMKDTGLFA